MEGVLMGTLTQLKPREQPTFLTFEEMRKEAMNSIGRFMDMPESGIMDISSIEMIEYSASFEELIAGIDTFLSEHSDIPASAAWLKGDLELIKGFAKVGTKRKKSHRGR